MKMSTSVALLAFLLGLLISYDFCDAKRSSKRNGNERSKSSGGVFGTFTNMFNVFTPKKTAIKSDSYVSIKTMDVTNAEVEGLAHLIFYDTAKNKSKIFTASKKYLTTGRSMDDVILKRGSNRTFWVKQTEGLKDINKIEIWHELPDKHTLSPEWKPELIQILRRKTGKITYFPLVRSLMPKIHYRFYRYDTFLPQNDPMSKRRNKEIRDNRKLYSFGKLNATVYNGVPMVKTLPPNQIFPGSYTATFGVNVARDTAMNIFTKQLKGGRWKEYDQMRGLFSGITGMPKPKYMDKDYTSDIWFAHQRLEGPNHVTIRLCKRIPKKFGVTSRMVYGLIEESTLKEAIELKKLFIADYHRMHFLQSRLNLLIAAPIALFYKDRKDVLNVIAIQLSQYHSKENPVFTPKVDRELWQLVKFHYQAADSAYHEAVPHFARSHVLMETFCCCTYRNLAPAHPIFRILRPHFLSTMAINKLALLLLVNKGGQIDVTMSISGAGTLLLAGDSLRGYNMTRNSIVPAMFELSGLTKDEIPEYAVREDYTDIYNAIKGYVMEIVHLYYKSDAVLRKDKEIRKWRREISAPTKNLRGSGLRGVPGDDKSGFRTRAELIETVTVIICTASAGHAKVNFLQYDWYGFAPHQPVFMAGPFPNDTRLDLDLEDVLGQFPDADKFMNLANLVKTLSNRLTKSLGDFEIPMFYEPKAMKIVQRFRRKLRSVQKLIEKRNLLRASSYPYLHPNVIPNAISI